MPSNEGRGYVLKKTLSRRLQDMEDCLELMESSLSKLCETVIESSKDGYPELEEKKDIDYSRLLSEEEDKFNKTIDPGLKHS
ncbi:MAG: alanine--tRNA ligase-related protein [Eubacterium ventriosum]